MAENIPKNHHFVPQFLLKNFSDIDNKTNVFYIQSQRIESRNIKHLFSKERLYEDASLSDIMQIEKLFSVLEEKASRVIKKILGERRQVVLSYSEIETLKRFLFLLEYRSRRRKQQYENELFDPLTKLVLAEKAKNGDYVSLWLRELKTILENRFDDIHKEELSFPIWVELEMRMNNTFLCIWEALEGERFILTDNFGTYEKSRKFLFTPLLYLFPISPRRILVLVFNELNIPRIWNTFDSEFSQEIVKPPQNLNSLMTSIDEKQAEYKIIRIKDFDVKHANALLLNETFEYFCFFDKESIVSSVQQYQNYSGNKNYFSGF